MLFAFIVFGVMYQVLGRYFPDVNWTGAGELALMSMVAMTFITTGYLVGRNGHIVLEIFDELLAGTKLFVALRVISAIIMAADEPRPRLRGVREDRDRVGPAQRRHAPAASASCTSSL